MNIIIDTQDMEERYGEELYKEYLENQNKEMKEKIDKAIEIIKLCDTKCAKELLEILGEKE